jgi:hypothetical protein
LALEYTLRFRLQSYTANATFFHPDFTVGPGISPDLQPRTEMRLARGLGPKAIPPVGNLTLP